MHKLRIEDLSVTSFSTVDAGEITRERGTVKGMALNPAFTQAQISCVQQFTCRPTECCSMNRTCEESCLGTCYVSCGGTCVTCIEVLCG